ncbi:MAG: SDR family oxidoreductase [Novosphingobium sp.]
MKLGSSVAGGVTGSASGLGAATVRALAVRSVKVALFDLNAVADEAIAKGIGGVFCEVNVTDDASVDTGFAKADAAHGQDRVLVNCAGIAPAAKTVGKNRETGEPRAHDMAAFMIGHDYLNGELIRFDGAIRIGPK